MAQNGNGRQLTSKWEWVAAAVSALIVLGILAILITEAAADESPPDITVRMDSVVTVGDGYVAQFTAANRGTNTAADVVITGELRDGSTLIESGSATLDYIPGEAERGGGMFFRQDPRTLTLHLKAAGWQHP